MRLTRFSDIGLRVLIYLERAGERPHPVTVAEIGKQFDITKRDVGKRLSGRARVRRGHVCHTIMRNTFFDVNRIEVCSGSRCFRAAALIN